MKTNDYTIEDNNDNPISLAVSKYTCEIHGDIGVNTINFNLPNWAERKFCLYCYQKMIMRHCCEVKESQ